jgi:prepilin peptidase CpaA
MFAHIVTNLALLVPLAVAIIHYDVRYRRIPNVLVLATLISGVTINSVHQGLDGMIASLGGCALAFFLMFVMHIFGAMGAGDVKLFAAIGSVIGLSLIIQTFFVIVLMGGALAVFSIIRAGTVRSTMHNVMMILLGLLPGWEMPRFTVPADRRHTIPYGVAITTGSLISLMLFHA